MKRSLAFSCWAVGGALVLTSSVALAETPVEDSALRLQWTREVGAESCVTSEELRRLLGQVLEGAAAPSALGDAAIEGTVRKGALPDTWQARIRVVAPDGAVLGERQLSTRQPLCASLTPSVLLVLLLLVDPDSADRGLPTEVVQSITDQADAEAEARRVSTPVPAPTALFEPSRIAPPLSSPERRAWSFRVHLEPTVHVGLLPAPTVGLAAGASWVTQDGWELALSGGYGGSSKIELEPTAYVQTGHVVVSALLASLAACPPLLTTRHLRAHGCVGATFVRRWFDTPSLAVHTDPARSSVGPSLSANAHLALSSQWHLRAEAAAATTLPRERFVYEDGEGVSFAVYTPSRFFASLGLGLGAEL